ncbi:peptidase C45 [Chitinophagaceae bacterium IBVUCB1]|nr:peptidase C45 [Chitinophagaceae bacterium IBVUCB1]
MRLLRWLLKCLAIFIGILLLVLIIFGVWVYSVSDNIVPPKIADSSALSLQVNNTDGSLQTIGNNWIRKNEYGLYEMYVSGKPFELGVKNGKLSQQLIVNQEIAFTQQIKQMIPSDGYLRFLKYMVGVINRDLPANIINEYQQEIYGISHAAADSFDWIGTNYARILNYHSAHDVGHALQNMMLVGCTSFGAWGGKTQDGSMLIGRNFDFWVGDKFAEEKMVAFYAPEKGHRFMFVTWGGFTGVVSGMNEKGLTVTINAAASDIPANTATPVSLVAREVLQYAANINEAIAIAKRRKMFVSESFMVGSAADHKTIIIEKTPKELAVYDPATDNIQCTNHYQSQTFATQKLNREQMANSASVYRYQRLQELMASNYPLTPQKMANILRDRKGIGNTDIGEGNEKAVNQLIAHHSVIFQPDSLRMWVSTAPWQLGVYVCYDMRKVFATRPVKDSPIAQNILNIPADSFIYTRQYKDFLVFRANKMALLQGKLVDTAATVRSNPLYYDAYRIAGDYCMQREWYAAAINYYNKALTLEIATKGERKAILEKIKEAVELNVKLQQ